MTIQHRSYPAPLTIDYPEKLDRVSTLFRLIFVIPILVILTLLTATAGDTATVITDSGEVVSKITTTGLGITGGLFVATMLMIVFRQRYPRWWFDFALNLNRFSNRVGAYIGVLTDRYPSTEDQQTVHLDLDHRPNTHRSACNESIEKRDDMSVDPIVTPEADRPTESSAPNIAKRPGGKMRAIVQDAYGSSDVLRSAESDLPEISSNEVLVDVAAAGMDRGTWHLMAGKPYLMRIIGFGFRRPKNLVPGLDVAGTVIAVGSDVTKFQPGDEVFGISRGGFAEFAAVREDKLAPKPANLSFEQAAVVPISGGTALQALRDSGRLEPGQKVLVIGASGGVGTYAVQLAKAFGAGVTGVSSTAKLELVRSIGADHALDYSRDEYLDGSKKYDLILDIGGNNSLSHLRRALTPHGTLVLVGGEEGGSLTGGFGRQLRALVLARFVGQRLAMLVSKERSTDLEALRPYLESGQVTPVVDRTFSLSEVPEAMRHLEAGLARGKLAITI